MASWKTTLLLLTLFLLSLFLELLLVEATIINSIDGGMNKGCIEVERKVLLEFKHGLKDPSGRLSSWVGADCCKWKGADCNNQTWNVVKVDLKYGGDFSRLGGEIRIPIPNFLGSFERLRYLNLSNAAFGGMIPLHLGNLSQLRYLDLFGGEYQMGVSNLNWLSGLSSLKYLDLGYMNLSKTTNWMQAVNMLPFLLELHLSNCELSHFPQYSNPFVNLTSLLVIDLSYSNFNATLPGWLFNINTLTDLYLNGANIKGPILQAGLGNLCHLVNLDLSFNNIGSEGIELVNYLPICSNNSLEGLDLSKNSILGSIPTWIGNLLRMKRLHLSFNLMNGTIPTTEIHFSNLTKLEYFSLHLSPKNQSLRFHVRPEWIPLFSLLYIHISNCYVLSPKNQLYGKLPNSSSFSPAADLVDLSFNRLVGRFPLWFNVTWLFLGNNLFSGPIPLNIGELLSLKVLDISGNLLNDGFPSSISKLKDLRVIDLSNNHLFGKIPKNWNDLHHLDTIDLSKNKLSGGIPSSMCSMSLLSSLTLGDINLSGELPPSLQNCIKLHSLDLGNNKFSGEIPKWIGERMSSLAQLRLRGNMLTGDIPEQLCWVSYLHILDLSVNNLSGSIPQCLGNLTTLSSVTLLDIEFDDNPGGHGSYSDRMELVVKGQDMEFDSILPIVNLIDLSSNNIWGEIPEEITNLSTLGTLNLSQNRLIGKIPKKIGTMQGLETLDLSCNCLSGPSPPSMTNSNKQLVLDIQRYPSIYEANLGLCGPPLSTNCSTLNDQDHKDDEEDEDEWDMSWFFISMGLGFPVGFWAVCGSLALKKSWRRAYFRFIDETRDRLYVFTIVNVARLKRR
ncbi:hypothetical protein PVL29_001337 [Vitis rotundifolia]|uniref:Leucine-rich repeat-containing N-terminal plant-type domain-containing protein n=1 Tax=Vitis rotundifolia TaxID=103349 RepID=A0AA39AM64_VITRO|nr:hypothetical protein PVL29_001337 [Vitis rotundifolia]